VDPGYIEESRRLACKTDKRTASRLKNSSAAADTPRTRPDPAGGRERLAKFGANELTERPRPGFLALLWDQFNNYLVIILIVAAVVSLALGEWVDSIAIMFIVVLNAVVGVFQESKAEQALAALKKMSARMPRSSAMASR